MRPAPRRSFHFAVAHGRSGLPQNAMESPYKTSMANCFVTSKLAKSCMNPVRIQLGSACRSCSRPWVKLA
eukprot:8801506-Karenia_brevis.AAC.1